MTLIQYIIQLNSDTHSVTHSFLQYEKWHSFIHSYTHGIEMVHGIVSKDDISLLQPPVMTDPVLLQSPCVDHGDLHRPHTIMENELVSPEIPLQHQM